MQQLQTLDPDEEATAAVEVAATGITLPHIEWESFYLDRSFKLVDLPCDENVFADSDPNCSQYHRSDYPNSRPIEDSTLAGWLSVLPNDALCDGIQGRGFVSLDPNSLGTAYPGDSSDYPSTGTYASCNSDGLIVEIGELVDGQFSGVTISRGHPSSRYPAAVTDIINWSNGAQGRNRTIDTRIFSPLPHHSRL